MSSKLHPTGQIKYLDVETGTVKERLYDPEDPTTVPEHQYNYSQPSATGYMWNKYIDPQIRNL